MLSRTSSLDSGRLLAPFLFFSPSDRTGRAEAQAVRDAGADYLLAVKANQPTLRDEIESFFANAPPETLDHAADIDKGHGRIEQRAVTVAREVDWLGGARRFPGEVRLPAVAAIVRVKSKVELKDRCRTDTRYYITSAPLAAQVAAEAVRGHWGIENQLHWVLDVVFDDDQSRLRKGHGALNMAVVRHFAINLVRKATEPARPRSGLRRAKKSPLLLPDPPASSSAGRSPDGTPSTSTPSSTLISVNLDSEPWVSADDQQA
ncbi:hypothetical protein [Azospirillum endophyticum]